MGTLLTTEVTGAKEAVVHLSSYSRHLEDFRALWPEITQAFVRREALWFGKQGEGTWPPLTDDYRDWKERVKPGRPKLVFSGDLKESLINAEQAKLAETDTVLVLGSNVPYAKFHQTGTSKMKARPPLIPEVRFKAAIARLVGIWANYRPGGWGQQIR